MEPEVVDPGIEDKRLLVQESEYARVLRVAGRDGNTLSSILRDAWDKGRLQTMTKNSAAKATGAHVSVIGHVTADELRRELSSTEAGKRLCQPLLVAVYEALPRIARRRQFGGKRPLAPGRTAGGGD